MKHSSWQTVDTLRHGQPRYDLTEPATIKNPEDDLFVVPILPFNVGALSPCDFPRLSPTDLGH